MLSQACKYAIRALLYLGVESDVDNKLGSQKIAEELEVPKPFLAQLLRNLATMKVISSTKGPGGGFYLDESNLQKNIWDVIEIIDGPQKFDECYLGLQKCDDAHPCPVHHLHSPFKKKIISDFKEKTISDYINEIKNNGTLLSLKHLGI